MIIVFGWLAYYSPKTAFEILGLTATCLAVLVAFVSASS
jgi:hypothetical protein